MLPDDLRAPPGAVPSPGGTTFSVWAPRASAVDVHIVSPFDKVVRMTRTDGGYHSVWIEGVEPGARYVFRLDDDAERPDPASRSQPDGVHGASEVRSTGSGWTDGDWTGLPLQNLVIYEAHIGTLTAEGTFDAAINVLDDLAELGVTAFELMPIAQFPGPRNWGYDGVYPYAPQDSYGGPDGLRRLVDACHARGLAVVLDVVYNHLGPEGCYFDDFGPYFTDRYRTPWGRAINFDGPGSDDVRRYFVGNALYWFDEFHVDALRLDAVHAIADTSAYPFLEELADATAALGRTAWLIAESAANDARIVAAKDLGGYGLHAQWNDDFHHALIALVTGERTGYYADYGQAEQLARSLAEGFVYQGEPSRFRGRRHGRPSAHVDPRRFVVFGTNHDQTGNRAAGDRLATRVSFDDLKLLATASLLSPYIPLLFMGEEYGETAPFQYFVSHSDPELVQAVRRGRRAEFEAFGWSEDVPDPQSEDTFVRSKIDRTLRDREPNATLYRFHRELLELRRDIPAFRSCRARAATASDDAVISRLSGDDEDVVVVMNFSTSQRDVALPDGRWQVVIDSDAEVWRGSGRTSGPDARGIAHLAPRSAAAYRPA